MRNNRILYLDVVKAIAICLVCIGHAKYLVTMDKPSVVNDWIYSFHMPLFMLLSGYFSAHALQQPFGRFVKKKALQLLVPAVVIPFLTVVVCILMGYDNISVTARAEAIGGMWFLKTLFACYLFVWIVKRLPLSDRWLCPLSILFACFFPHGYFLQFNWMLIFFWAGYFLKKETTRYERHRLVITVVCAVVFLFAGRHTRPILLTYHNLFTQPLVIVWQLVTALSASLAVVGVTYYVCKYFNGSVMQAIGRMGVCTLGIYGIQAIVLQRIFVSYIHFDLTSLPFWFADGVIFPCLGIASAIICYWLVIWLRRYRVADILLFGGQYSAKSKSLSK